MATSLLSQNASDDSFDWQGHRGARGLLPENTIPAFIEALEHKVTTLELDVAITKDKKVIISHEPWMSYHICSYPNGTLVREDESRNLRIFDMTYDEVKTYDCGIRGNERFPQQKPMNAHKPSLAELVKEVKEYCFMRKLEMPNFNIEIKSDPKLDVQFTPPPKEFVEILLNEINSLGIKGKCFVQSFDVRPLQELKKLNNGIPLILLVENEDGIKPNLEKLGFTPDGYSPYYKLLKKRDIRYLHKQNINVVPWTVNEVKAMKKLIRKGVDGIITDYPNLIVEVGKNKR